tara:strand:- start:687 stop:935 length:249 start_codon:yes stop_codon:yes gene_type:complete
MNVIIEFIEKYSRLSDMKAGDTAVSKDRKDFYVCGYHYDTLKKKNVEVILNVNSLFDQYTDNRDLSAYVKILKKDDKFMCSI